MNNHRYLLQQVWASTMAGTPCMLVYAFGCTGLDAPPPSTVYVVRPVDEKTNPFLEYLQIERQA